MKKLTSTYIISYIFSGLYYKSIFTIISDDRKWSLYYNVIYDCHLTLASIVNYNRKWCYNLERHTSGVNYDRNKFIIQATGFLN
jgi:hypothetical protein